MSSATEPVPKQAHETYGYFHSTPGNDQTSNVSLSGLKHAGKSTINRIVPTRTRTLSGSQFTSSNASQQPLAQLPIVHRLQQTRLLQSPELRVPSNATNWNGTGTNTIANERLRQLRDEYQKVKNKQSSYPSTHRYKSAHLNDTGFVLSSSDQYPPSCLTTSPTDSRISTIINGTTLINDNELNSHNVNYEPTSNTVTNLGRPQNRRAYVRSNSDTNVAFGNYDALSLFELNKNKFKFDRESTNRTNKLITDVRNQNAQELQDKFSFSKLKINGHSSDTDVSDVRKKLTMTPRSTSSQNLSEIEGNYDYPDYTGIKNGRAIQSSKYFSPNQNNITLRSNESKGNSPSIRRDIKSSIVVNCDVPSLLKTFKNHDPSTKSKCDIKRIREVKKIIRAWEVERILQDDDPTKVGTVRMLQSSNERTIDRTVSEHKEERTIGAITDELSLIAEKSKYMHSSPEMRTEHGRRFTHGNRFIHSLNTSPLMFNSTDFDTPIRSPDRRYTSQDSSFGSNPARSSVRSSSSGVSHLSLLSPHSTSNFTPPPYLNTTRHSFQNTTSYSPNQGNLSPCIPVSSPANSTNFSKTPSRSDSLEGITIDSLMEQLKALS